MRHATGSRILLVEDEPKIAKGIIYNLEKQDYVVTHATDGVTGESAARHGTFDVIVLDVMLPGMNGFEVCTHLREAQVTTPILMLTARSEVEDRIMGLHSGADDYLGKPFDIRELLARIEALIRRNQRTPTNIAELNSSKIILGSGSHGEVLLDSNRFELVCTTKAVTLTAIELRLLTYFIQKQGQAIARSEILKHVWGFNEEVQTRTLDTFIMRVRNHITEVGGRADWIASVRGVGYRFDTRIIPN